MVMKRFAVFVSLVAAASIVGFPAVAHASEQARVGPLRAVHHSGSDRQ
jgi:hypothetical protein